MQYLSTLLREVQVFAMCVNHVIRGHWDMNLIINAHTPNKNKNKNYFIISVSDKTFEHLKKVI
jgi:hypothetical protein